MKTLKRIVTFISRPKLCEDPWELLLGGSGVIKCPPELRYFAVRDIVYDDSLTPLYMKGGVWDNRYKSLEALKSDPKVSDTVKDSPVLDFEHSLKIYEHE